MVMRMLPLVIFSLTLAGCAWNDGEARAACVLTVNCVTAQPAHGYGPLHSQVAAPVGPPALEPR